MDIDWEYTGSGTASTFTASASGMVTYEGRVERRPNGTWDWRVEAQNHRGEILESGEGVERNEESAKDAAGEWIGEDA